MVDNKGINEFDPNKARVSDLRKILRDHNQPITGAKSVLIITTKSVPNLDLPNVKRLRESDTEEKPLEEIDQSTR